MDSQWPMWCALTLRTVERRRDAAVHQQRGVGGHALVADLDLLHATDAIALPALLEREEIAAPLLGLGG